MGKDVEKSLAVAEELTKKLLKDLGFSTKVEARQEKDFVQVNVSGADLGLLIGYHGENLGALQLILGLMINKKLEAEDWTPINLDVGGWRDERLDALKSLVEKAATEVGASKKEIALPPMPASQRRSVHMILAEEFPHLTSESEGEEPNRRIVIKKAS